MTLRDLVGLARPWQWTKNAIVFAGLVFSLNLFDPAYIFRSLTAFLVFCLASSAIYVMNDLFDAERDRVHPIKRDRPIPRGAVSPAGAWVLFVGLAVVALLGGVWLGREFLIAVGAFLTLNIAYSVKLKHIVILDVMLIALSFVIRAIAGVVALRPVDPGLELSPWLLVCTLFLALFLALAKRRHELGLLEEGAAGHRAVLGEYSPAFLDQLITIVTAATLISYAIYTIAPGTVSKFHSPSLVYTIPFVAYGVFRYLYLIRIRQEGGNPSRTLYRDGPILLTTVGWMITVVAVIYADSF